VSRPLAAAEERAFAYIDGNDLYAYVASKPDFANGYILGAHDAAQWRNVATSCIDHDVKAMQVVDVVKKWLAGHPQVRHKGAVPIVRQAMADAWPCRK
jgi:hypothetical protein